MIWFYSLIICFSMYSIIPMPKVSWENKNMSYILAFFPLVGVVVGSCFLGVFSFATSLFLNNIFSSILLLLTPIVLTGAIHFDGLIDTCDAIFSYGEKEKKLAIMSDPRTGAFGVIGAIIYILILFGATTQLLTNNKLVLLLPFVFVISRAVSALALLTIKNAKPNGLGASFSNSANKKLNIIILIAWILVAFCFVFIINSSMFITFVVVILVYILFYKSFILKNFGGITGDLTGFLLLTIELLLIICIAVGGKLC